MRVVAGTAGGRRLLAPRGLDLRPTSERVREALFSSLTSLDVVVGATVLDLFAGSGALGIEALSRGAAAATFLERDARALEALRANLAATGLEGATVVAGDALRFVETAPPFDLVVADPPYGFDRWDDLLASVSAGTAAFESDRDLEVGASWQVLKRKRYGGTVLTLVRPVLPQEA